jgi:hypothetical protein
MSDGQTKMDELARDAMPPIGENLDGQASQKVRVTLSFLFKQLAERRSILRFRCLPQTSIK